MSTPSAAVDALCDRLEGDRNLRIATYNVVTIPKEHNCEDGETVQNVSKMGMEIEAFGQSVTGINTIEELAETWCKVKGYEYSGVVRHDSLTYAECKKGMIVLWKER
jgi:hypothetical protein